MTRKRTPTTDLSATMTRRMAIAAMVMGLPIALQALLPLWPGTGAPVTASISDINPVSGERQEQRIRRNRAYYEAIERCQELRASGKNVACPDPNDFRGILELREGGEEDVPNHASPTLRQVIPHLDVDDLNEVERALLTQFTRAGTCPETLLNYVPGFYDLCTALVEGGSRARLRGEVDALARQRILRPIGD